MKTCPTCQRMYSDMTSVCPKCGTALSGGSPAPQYQAPQRPQYEAPRQPQYQAPQQPQYQAPQQPQYQAPQQPQYQAPVQEVKKQNTGKNWMMRIVIVAVVYLLARGIGSTIGKSYNQPATPSSPATIDDILIKVTPEWMELLGEHMLYEVVNAVDVSGPYKGFALWRDSDQLFIWIILGYSGDVVTQQTDAFAVAKSSAEYSDVVDYANAFKSKLANCSKAGVLTFSNVSEVGQYYMFTYTISNMDKPETCQAMAADGFTSGVGGQISLKLSGDNLIREGYIAQYEK